MSRSSSNTLTQFGDVFDRSYLSNKRRALQQGTPKWLPAGEARAAYALLSNNTSSTVGGVAFFDKYFQPVRPSVNPSASGTPSMTGNFQNAASGDIQLYSGLFYGISATQTQASTTATTNFMNATNAAGEFGNAMVDVFSNSTIVSSYNRSANNYANKHSLNRSFIDSDHSDQTIAYIQYGQVLRAVSRIQGDVSFNAPGTKHITLTDLSSSSYGSMTYNAVRRELVAVQYVGSGGNMKVITWKNVDFNRFPSPHIAMTQPDVIKVTKTLASMVSWSVNNAESYYNSKPVLCDNGDIYLSVMFTSSTLSMYKLVRDANLDITVSLVGTRTLTTSYGADQNPTQYGQRKIQSRDGGSVLCFCAYYYYGAGMASFIVDKRKSTWINNSWMQDSNTAAGVIPVPFGDNGFAAYFCGNVYASNYTGGYITSACLRDGDNDIVQTASAMYLPYFTLPNTTNYPGFTQVVDYSMLDNQALV